MMDAGKGHRAGVSGPLAAGLLPSAAALPAGGACCAPVFVLLPGPHLSALLANVFPLIVPGPLILLLEDPLAPPTAETPR